MKRFLLTLVLAAVASMAFATPVSVALPIPCLWAGLFDNSGQPLAGGAVYFYRAGQGLGLTTKTVWDNASKAPGGARTSVTLDAHGRAQVYGDMVDGYRYKLRVFDSDGSWCYDVDGLEVVSNIAPPTFHPGYLDTPLATIASLTVSGQASIASLTSNKFHLSNGVMTLSDIYNSDLASVSLSGAWLLDNFDARLHLINNVATPAAAMDAARLYEITQLNASVSADVASGDAYIAFNEARAASEAGRISNLQASMSYVASYAFGPSYGYSVPYDDGDGLTQIATDTELVVDTVLHSNYTPATQTVMIFANVELHSQYGAANNYELYGDVEIKAGAVILQKRRIQQLGNTGGYLINGRQLMGFDTLPPGVGHTYTVTVYAYRACSVARRALSTPPYGGIIQIIGF